MASAPIRALRDQLDATPGDPAVRGALAEALDAEGRLADALPVLAALINLTGHDDDAGLPCLCRQCLQQAATTAEAAGMRFTRSFAVHGTRVLHFWQPAELEHERIQVRRSVADGMRARADAMKGRRP